VGAPKDNRFQVISEYDTDSFPFDPDYIGIHRTNDLVIIQITSNEGRNPEQKKALYKAIADGLHSAVGFRREDVFISLVEVKKENWSYGNGIAQSAV
jgi:4-oxalocrotonate tautomerase